MYKNISEHKSWYMIVYAYVRAYVTEGFHTQPNDTSQVPKVPPKYPPKYPKVPQSTPKYPKVPQSPSKVPGSTRYYQVLPKVPVLEN